MKKTITSLVIVSLALALVAMSIGCGGGENDTDKGSARELMQVGDAWNEKAEADFETMTSAWEKMMGGNSSGGTDINNGDAKSLTQEIQSALQGMGDSLDNAKSAFQAITTLTDARDYKDYANVMLELIAEYEQLLSMQKDIQQRIAQGGMPPAGTAPPSGSRAPPESDGGIPQGGVPPAGGAPPSGAMPPAGHGRGGVRGGGVRKLTGQKGG